MAVRAFPVYPIGTKGVAWGEAEREQWRSAQAKKREYTVDVLDAVKATFSTNQALAAVADVVSYGTLDYAKLNIAPYHMIAVKSKTFRKELRTVLVTGGVHGYETSGVHGALQFIKEKFTEFADKVNLLVLPCISPWGYETINRWTPEAIDPNRSFNPEAPGCPEAALAMRFVAETCKEGGDFLVHMDLHETTDTDNSEFTPAKFARDGVEPEEWTEIPDGFYLVGDSQKPAQLGFHAATIAAVKTVTHIAPPDEQNRLVGEPLVQEGLVVAPNTEERLCASQTSAPYVATTEVYPDSPKSSPEICNKAQVACVVAAIEYALANLV